MKCPICGEDMALVYVEEIEQYSCFNCGCNVSKEKEKDN